MAFATGYHASAMNPRSLDESMEHFIYIYINWSSP
jgi:hypothetical protein